MSGHNSHNEEQFVTKPSQRSVPDTVARLIELINAKDIKLFAVIDQREQAHQVGLELPEMILVIFGNPSAGTPVMAFEPLAGLDLPLKVLVWAQGDQTNISYMAPSAITARYHLTTELATKLAGIDALTDELIT